jgi:uncharacterized repeat protein (TIGR01451 family)
MELSKTILVAITLLLTTSIFADNELKVTTRLFEQIGESATQLKSLDEAIPETVVVYEHTLVNPTMTLATDLIFTDIVPKHTTFVGASCQNCTILYSVDGEVFEQASELFTYQSNTLRTAHPKEYRFVKWIIDRLEPNSQQKVSFRTKIE